MLKIPNPLKMPISEQQPRITKIERPTPGKRLNPLKLSMIQPHRTVAKNNRNVTEDLKSRLQVLQKRVKEWKATNNV